MFRHFRSDVCLGGCHVHSFVRCMSLVYIVCSLVLLIAALAAGFAPIALLPLVTLGLAALTFCGNHYSISCLYLPGLIFEFISAFLILLGAFGVCLYGFYLLYIHNEDFSEERARNESVVTVGMGIGTILVGFACVVLALIHAYLVHVFFRDYKYVKSQRANSLPTTMDDEYK